MLGGTQLTSIIGAGIDNTDHEAVKAYVRALCNAGVAVMFIQPGTKEPYDARTGQAKGIANRAAQEEARLAGRLDWDRVKAPAGLYLATTDAALALRYLKKYVETYSTYSNDDGNGNTVAPFITEPVAVNLAIETGRSRLVVVDADTAEQVAEFLTRSGAPEGMPPTISTPGKVVDGNWVHSNGGHFYFTVPEGVDLPTEVGSMNLGATGYAVLWHNRYVLIPPSTRAEGSYETVGRDYELPDWLRIEIETRSTARRDRAEASRARSDEAGTLDPIIDAWARQVSWHDILAPLGWVPVSSIDRSCGCPVFTAPGDHASPKSATGHEAGCSLGRWDNDVNAPLHIWTDNPGAPFDAYVREHDTKTLSKLQAIALTEYDGDQGAAMTALGLHPPTVSVPGIEGTGPIADEEGTGSANLDSVTVEEAPPNTLPRCSWCEGLHDGGPENCPSHTPPIDLTAHNTTNPVEVTMDIQALSLEQLAGDDSDFPNVGAVNAETGLYLPREPGVPEMAPFDYWAELPPPEFIIDGLLEHRGLSSLIGAPGAGKSTVALDMACHIATGRRWQGRAVLQTRVLYLPGEGLAGVVQRLHAWCDARETRLGGNLILGRSILQLGASREAWAELREYVVREGIGLIVFDTFARMAVGIEENSSTEVGKAIKRFDQVRELTHCGVMVVHHTGKSTPDVARGSSALNGALDSEILVSADVERIAIPGTNTWGRQLHLRTTKQKNVEREDDEIDLMMVNWEPRKAALITGPNGNIDPMQGEILTARPIPEPLIETAVRIRAFVDRFPEQGVTRTDIAQGVRADAYTASLGAAEVRAWRLKVAEAVDRSLRWELLTTLSGTPSGARYIPGDQGIEAARAASAAEVMVADV